METKKHVFTPREKKLLLDILKKYEVIHNKNTDGATLRAKNAAWNRVARQFNANPLICSQASSKQLRRLWSNLKQNFKQKQREATERPRRLVARGGNSTRDAAVGPDVAQVAPSPEQTRQYELDVPFSQKVVVHTQDPLSLSPTMPTSQSRPSVSRPSSAQMNQPRSASASPLHFSADSVSTVPYSAPAVNASNLPSAISLKSQKRIIIQKEFNERQHRANELALVKELRLALVKEKVREAKARADLAEMVLLNLKSAKIMQRNSDRWPDDYDPDTPRSRPGSRRNSASLSRRSSLKKEKEGKKKSPLNTAPSSSSSTPKKVVKPQNLEFVVTGKQILKRGDRANSLPGYHRRPSAESLPAVKKRVETKRHVDSQSSKSRETSLEDDMSLELSQITESITVTLSKTCCDGDCPQNTSKSSRSDDTSEDVLLNLSQVSDFEDTNSKYGVKQKFRALATSTPKNQPKTLQKPRSASLQSQMHSQMVESSRRNQKVLEGKSRESTFSCSRDSLYKTSSAGSYRYGNISTELDYSSVSPEYSGQSSTDVSPRVARADGISPQSQELHASSCCVSSWQESEADLTKMEDQRRADRGEWNSFWANYNNSLAQVPIKTYYDQCPTPYRTETIDMADLELSDTSRKRSPADINNLNSIIRNEGLHLTPRETQNIIKCAHILGNVLSKAIERRSKEKDENEEKIQEINVEKEKVDPEVEIKKKNMTLDLKETNEPLEVQEEKRCETVTTQTDISLPNTKSAPKIFEKILRQLSKTSLDESLEKNMEKKVMIAGVKEEKAEVQKEN